MCYLGIVLLGLLALRDLEVNLLPEMELPRLTIATVYPASAPGEIENLITRPITESVGTVGGLKRIDSESLEGVSFVTLQFDWDTKIDFAVMAVREKLDLIRGVLPEDAGRSVISRFDPSQSPFIEIVVFARKMSEPRDLRHYLEKNVKIYLDRVDGVAQVEFAGGYHKEVQIEVDARALASYGKSFPEVGRAITSANLSAPAGSITVGTTDVLIRTLGEFQSVTDVAETVIGSSDAGTPIRLSQVAEVRDGYRERTGLARYNGREAVVLSLRKESGKNTVRVAAAVREAVDEIRERFGEDFDIHIVYDESRFVQNAIDNITIELVSGGLLAFAALVLILRNLQSPFVVLTVLPVSVLATFFLMYLFDVSINMMSLGGLSLGVGMLFDGANVALSAIERHRANGLQRSDAALVGAHEVVGSISAAVLTTVMVFLPVVFLKSVVGVVFAEMALTITCSLFVSLLVALTLVPMLASLEWPAAFQEDLIRLPLFAGFARWQENVENKYVDRLAQALDRPRRLFIPIAGLFFIALAFAPFVQREFVPRVDTGEFMIEVENVSGSSLESTSDLAAQLESVILEHPDVDHVISSAGFDEDQLLARRGGDVGEHRARMRVVLSEDRDESARELAATLREQTKLRDDIKVNYVVSGDVLSEILTPESRAITLELSGDDLAVLTELGEMIRGDVAAMPGVVDARASLRKQARELHVIFDDLRMASVAMSRDYLSRYLRTAIDGDVLTRLHVQDEEIDIRLRLREADRRTLAAIDGLWIKSESGDEQTPLDQLVSVHERNGHTSILRTGATRVNLITADIQGGNRNRIFADLDRYIAGLKLPEGYRIAQGGEREHLSSALRELLFAFGLAAILVYMILAGQVESTLYPWPMLLTIPLMAIGIVPALLLTGHSLNVSSFTGIILLIGIVVDNAALFFEYVEVLRASGAELRAAIVESGRIVLRPLFLNNSTTLLGLVPAAIAIGAGTEFQAALAVTVIAGLLTSVILSLFVIPVTFYYIIRWREGRAPSREILPTVIAQ